MYCGIFKKINHSRNIKAGTYALEKLEQTKLHKTHSSMFLLDMFLNYALRLPKTELMAC